METSELSALMNDRALAYGFTAQAFRTSPDAAFLEALRATAENRPDDDPFAPFFAQLAEEDLKQLRIDIAADFNRLFLGMGPNPLPPYESVYTSPERLLMQDARDEVVAVYRSAGLTAPEGFALPEDHLALELGFMADMAKRTHDALGGDDGSAVVSNIALQKAFLTDHLMRWVPAFCSDVETRARTTYLRALAALTREQLAADVEVLAEL